MSEEIVQRQIKLYLTACNIPFWRVNAGRKGRTISKIKGVPDLIGFYKDKFFGIECKADKKSNISDEQIDFSLKAKKADQLHCFAYGIDCVQKMFNKYDRDSERDMDAVSRDRARF